MKRLTKIFPIIALAATICSCGEDRSSEFYDLTKENQWTYNKMKEVYLWADSIKEIDQRTYFSGASLFFNKLLYKNDQKSFFTDTEETTYGLKFSLMRDPLGIAPAKVYALVEYVEPASVAAVAGLERGMWISTINGNNINMGSGGLLASGNAKTLGVNRIIYDDDKDVYAWEELPAIEMQAAVKAETSSLPVTTIINDTSGKIGYILCNSFDGEAAITYFNSVLSDFVAENVSNIILDLRYNNSNVLIDAATAAAPFVPAAERQTGVFCSLYKDLKLTVKEDICLPQSSIDVSNMPLYIITTPQTTGTANAFVKAIRMARGNSTVKIVGKTLTGTNIATERFESPYMFEINPATAFIADANGELLMPITPDFVLNEIGDYKHIYQLGDKQEYLLYNITYIIANGTLPANR